MALRFLIGRDELHEALLDERGDGAGINDLGKSKRVFHACTPRTHKVNARPSTTAAGVVTEPRRRAP